MSDASRTSSRPFRDPASESLPARLVLIAIAFLFLAAFLVLPLVSVFFEAFRKGADAFGKRSSSRMLSPPSV